MINKNLNLQKFLIQKNNVVNNNKDIILRFKEKMCAKKYSVNCTQLSDIHVFIETFFFVFVICN